MQDALTLAKNRLFGVIGESKEIGWPLASFQQRLLAWLLEIFVIPISTLGIGGVGYWIIRANGNIPDVFSFLLVFLIVVAVNVCWWLMAMRGGQSPGKQIVGIRVVRSDGSPCRFWRMALREVAVKFVIVGSMAQLTLGAVWLLDCLWILWDRSGRRQTLHDKLLGTLVVQHWWKPDRDEGGAEQRVQG